MKRLAGTVLGLLFAQVAVSWRCPRGASEGLSSCCIVEGERGTDKSCRLSILLIIYGSCVCVCGGVTFKVLLELQ